MLGAWLLDLSNLRLFNGILWFLNQYCNSTLDLYQYILHLTSNLPSDILPSFYRFPSGFHSFSKSFVPSFDFPSFFSFHSDFYKMHYFLCLSAIEVILLLSHVDSSSFFYLEISSRIYLVMAKFPSASFPKLVSISTSNWSSFVPYAFRYESHLLDFLILFLDLTHYPYSVCLISHELVNR